MHLLNIFQKTPTVEEVRQNVFDSLKYHNVNMPQDTVLHKEIINGFKYIQQWISYKYHILYLVTCADVRNKNCPITIQKRAI